MIEDLVTDQGETRLRKAYLAAGGSVLRQLSARARRSLGGVGFRPTNQGNVSRAIHRSPITDYR